MSDGTVAVDGTVVTAFFGDEEVATATVESSFQPGFYLLNVPKPTGIIPVVTFRVGLEMTLASVTWVERTSEELNLTGEGSDEEPAGEYVIQSGSAAEFSFDRETLEEVLDSLPPGEGKVWFRIDSEGVVSVLRVEAVDGNDS
jgi:hypothetical protein